MTIASLSGFPYASLLDYQFGSANSASISGAAADPLLAALGQPQGSTSSSADLPLQDQVSLSPSALGQPSSTPQTYNAKGLLAQIESNLMLNDPLLQSDTNDSGDSVGDSLLQSLMSSQQASTTAATDAAKAKLAGTQGAVAPAANSAAAASNDWAQVLKQNPSLAGTLMQGQVTHNLISLQ